ncbi:DUF2515 domain-containing protein [Bacillus multifaciens]|uniref:DUF2515 domain-containing protein n=1 Tax=Bacillus multifaciens TaxID=3068506 RepID=UPI0027421317|nr:DUF2515 domain-containing protein [Bacillus sp. WLY-B-L8]MDP7978404.1 DUF2515 domain-containing protein [Bacillus sp. WLY-B-L8]
MFMQREYEKIRRKRKISSYTNEEKELVNYIQQQTILANADNISRTHAYKEYYERNKEIRWSFLASMVSRNAGWNMTDLEGKYYPKVLSQEIRKQLFLTYERANWLIFLDAYPQLLLYEYSKRMKKPLFHLLQMFSVSVFMEGEWSRFWEQKKEERLMTALIINEQCTIQEPVIEHPFYQKHIFQTLMFKFQELFHFSAVIFPTIAGNLYGFSVHQFETLTKRIELGKQLAWLLFSPTYKELFDTFSSQTVHTGSRFDYEQYLNLSKEQDTPQLRDVFSVVSHHRKAEKDWFQSGVDVEELFLFEKPKEEVEITEWFLQKQKQLHFFASVQSFF